MADGRLDVEIGARLAQWVPENRDAALDLFDRLNPSKQKKKQWLDWLEDVSLAGATTLHGPVSATVQAPTAVTLSVMDASPAAAAAWPWLWLLAGAGAALAIGRRRRA